MPTVIYTGNPAKCKQLNMLECPVCGESFELMEGIYILSSLLDSEVKVCKKHISFSVADEFKIQEAMQRALEHPRGRVTKDQKLLKRCRILEAANYQPKKDW